VNVIPAVLIAVLTAALALLGTLALERHAHRLGLVKAPNERSSHTRPTPRGGGLAIAVAIVVAAIPAGLTGMTTLWPVVLTTSAIAALGFADDLMDLPAGLRFPVQLVIILVLLVAISPLPEIAIGPWRLGGWYLGALLAVVGLWWVNLYNFMDGIDGIAASHAILIPTQALIIIATAGPGANSSAVMLAATTIAASAGFLIRNWPPARIFMGDAGSNALALMIFALALISLASGALTYQVWLILPAVFVSDATVTLVRRALRGEAPWKAHRRHAYQQLARLLGHRTTTLIYCLFSLSWAFPLALLAEHLPEYSWQIVALAYLPLVVATLAAGGGAASESASSSVAS
jgi:Fuc2NAc and GlcNAc transferase